MPGPLKKRPPPPKIEAAILEQKELNAKRGKGQPAIVINEVQLYKLAQTMLPTISIANILECSTKTIEDNYSLVLQRGRDDRRRSLSEAMWHKALEEKNVTMQIWLSKQHLGYKEKHDEGPGQVNFNVFTIEVPR